MYFLCVIPSEGKHIRKKAENRIERYDADVPRSRKILTSLLKPDQHLIPLISPDPTWTHLICASGQDSSVHLCLTLTLTYNEVLKSLPTTFHHHSQAWLMPQLDVRQWLTTPPPNPMTLRDAHLQKIVTLHHCDVDCKVCDWLAFSTSVPICSLSCFCPHF